MLEEGLKGLWGGCIFTDDLCALYKKPGLKANYDVLFQMQSIKLRWK